MVLFGKRVPADVIKLGQGHTGFSMGPSTEVPIRRKKFGYSFFPVSLCEDTGRDLSDAAKECQGFASNHQKLGACRRKIRP